MVPLNYQEEILNVTNLHHPRFTEFDEIPFFYVCGTIFSEMADAIRMKLGGCIQFTLSYGLVNFSTSGPEVKPVFFRNIQPSSQLYEMTHLSRRISLIIT